MSISSALQEESCTPVCVCVCVCVWVCLCVGVNIKYVFTVSGLHPGFWIRGGRIGEMKNIGGAKLSELLYAY